MVPEGEVAISFLYLISTGGLANPQDLVIISLFHHLSIAQLRSLKWRHHDTTARLVSVSIFGDTIPQWVSEDFLLEATTDNHLFYQYQECGDYWKKL
jgi:hypothetical protein